MQNQNDCEHNNVEMIVYSSSNRTFIRSYDGWNFCMEQFESDHTFRIKCKECGKINIYPVGKVPERFKERITEFKEWMKEEVKKPLED